MKSVCSLLGEQGEYAYLWHPSPGAPTRTFLLHREIYSKEAFSFSCKVLIEKKGTSILAPMRKCCNFLPKKKLKSTFHSSREMKSLEIRRCFPASSLHLHRFPISNHKKSFRDTGQASPAATPVPPLPVPRGLLPPWGGCRERAEPESHSPTLEITRPRKGPATQFQGNT